MSDRNPALDHWDRFRQRVIKAMGEDMPAIHALGVLEGAALRGEQVTTLMFEHLMSAQSEMHRLSKKLYERSVELAKARTERDAAVARIAELEAEVEC